MAAQRPDVCAARRGHGGGGRHHPVKMPLARGGVVSLSAAAWARAGACGECRQFQRLHRQSRPGGGRGDHRARCGPCRVPAVRRVRGLNGRDRRTAPYPHRRSRHRRRAGGAGNRLGRCGRRDLHHRHLPQRRDGDRYGRRPHRHHRWCHQGIGHDRAGYGDDAGLPVHRRGGRAGLPAGAAVRGQ